MMKFSGPLKTRRKSTRKSCRRRDRSGATMVELAITILVFITAVLGLMDLGLANLRHQQLTEATRFVSRQAAVHGNLADALGIWGPGQITGRANDGSAVGNLFVNRMTVPNPGDLQFTLDWIDNGNDSRNDDRVRVTASLPYQTFATLIFGNQVITLQSISVVPIAH